jgi:hypothetical protein
MRDRAELLRQFFGAAVLMIAIALTAQQIPTAAPQGNQDTHPAPKGASSERNPAAPQNASAEANNASRITVQGCLNGGKQGYTLVQASTGAGFELENEPYQLKNMRGKMVAITGREMAPAQGSQLPRLQIEKLEVTSDHCVLPGNAAGASTTVPQPGTNQNNANPNAPDAATPKYQSPGAPNQTPPSQGNNPTNWGRTSGAPSPGTGNPPPATGNPPPPK